MSFARDCSNNGSRFDAILLADFDAVARPHRGTLWLAAGAPAGTVLPTLERLRITPVFKRRRQELTVLIEDFLAANLAVGAAVLVIVRAIVMDSARQHC